MKGILKEAAGAKEWKQRRGQCVQANTASLCYCVSGGSQGGVEPRLEVAARG